jgi:hypothetical protein
VYYAHTNTDGLGDIHADVDVYADTHSDTDVYTNVDVYSDVDKYAYHYTSVWNVL